MTFNKHDILDLLKVNELGKGSLVGLKCNLNGLITYTVYKLKDAGWIEVDIQKMVEECRSGNYFHSVQVLSICLNDDKYIH